MLLIRQSLKFCIILSQLELLNVLEQAQKEVSEVTGHMCRNIKQYPVASQDANKCCC